MDSDNTNRRFSWKPELTPATFISVLALLISGTSLFQSFRSFSLSKATSERADAIVFTGQITNGKIKLAQLNDEMKILKVVVDGGVNFNLAPFELGRNLEVDMNTFGGGIMRTILDKNKNSASRYNVVSFSFPINIKTDYLNNGSRLSKSSVYDIEVGFGPTLDKCKAAVFVKGFQFARHLSEDGGYQFDKSRDRSIGPADEKPEYSKCERLELVGIEKAL